MPWLPKECGRCGQPRSDSNANLLEDGISTELSFVQRTNPEDDYANALGPIARIRRRSLFLAQNFLQHLCIGYNAIRHVIGKRGRFGAIIFKNQI